ncbi:MAG: hypothetical protein H8E59_08575 [Actinobacteria bacterium]|nr:hypothetical protein [Actinomycetota bacterium]
MAVTVSPREVVDEVHRASRALGCDADLADRLAVEVAFCEVHHGGGVAAWAELVATGDGRLAEAALAPFRLADAEVALRTDGSTRLDLDPPVPLAVLARSLWDLERRGVRCTPDPEGCPGTELLSTLELVARDPDPVAGERVAERSQEALNHGVDVDDDLWRLLHDRARAFLVAESVLDAVHAVGEGGI